MSKKGLWKIFDRDSAKVSAACLINLFLYTRVKLQRNWVKVIWSRLMRIWANWRNSVSEALYQGSSNSGLRSGSRPWLGFNRTARHYNNGSILPFLQLKVSSTSKQLSRTHHKRSGSFMANALSCKPFLFCEHCFSLLLKRHIEKLCLYFNISSRITVSSKIDWYFL